MLGFLNRKPAISNTVAEALNGSYSDHEMREIDRIGTHVRLDEGSYLTTEGAPGAEVIVLLSGTADVVRDSAVIATVTTGDVVGETAVLTGEPRNATLVATSEVDVAVFNRREFDQLLASCPRLNVQVKQLVEARS